MTLKITPEMRRQVKVFKALAHPSRIFIVKQLAEGEKCVCELVEPIGSDFSTVSRHLLALKNAAIIIDEKRGKQVFYRLTMPCVVNFLSCIG